MCSHAGMRYIVGGRPPVWYQSSPLVWQIIFETIHEFPEEIEYFRKVNHRLSAGPSNIHLRRILQVIAACKPLHLFCLQTSEGSSSYLYSTNLKPFLAASPEIPSPMLTTAPSIASPRLSFLFKLTRTKRSKVAAQIAINAVTQFTDIATTSKIVSASFHVNLPSKIIIYVPPWLTVARASRLRIHITRIY